MVELLVLTEAVDVTLGKDTLYTLVAMTLEEGLEHGIRTERLLGMYLLLRLSDHIDPYTLNDYKAVLLAEDMAEDDKAHILQIMRLKRIEAMGVA